MPIDPMFSESILSSFRGMAKEMDDKNITGPDVDQMKAALGRMEQLANELSDLNEFNGLIMQENLYMKFSDHYGRALSNASKAQYQVNSNVYDEKSDRQLMNQTLNAYRDAIKRLQEAKKENVKQHGEKASKVFLDTDHLIKPIEDVIKLGESGITYAAFLRMMIEQGMDKAMEGSIVGRNAIVYSKEFYEAGKISPHYDERETRNLALYDELTATSKFHVPSILKYNLGCEKIAVEIDPKIKKWDAIKDAFDRILSELSFWSMANMTFAHTLEPWSMAANPREAVKRTVECTPGEHAVQLKQFKKYFGLDFYDIFTHEIFLWDVTWHHIWYSQEYINFLKDEVKPICLPGNKLSPELVSKMEKIYKEDRMRNPDLHKVAERYKENHDKYFGEGTYEAKHGPIAKYGGGAASWNLAEF
ncbi:MAG TPA: hypothetical protein VD905_02395 [Flavobacteriales bacterium]|nr:hypothetical protein [Flavobacteriales bacterium]